MSGDEEAEEPQPEAEEPQSDASGDQAVEEVARRRRRSGSGRLPLNGLEALLRNHPAFTFSQPRWMQDLAKQANAASRLMDSINRAVPSKTFLDVHNRLSKLNVVPPSVTFVVDSRGLQQLQQLADTIDRLTRLPAINFPHNWFPATWDKLKDEELDAAMTIVREEGIPLVWVPRAEIVVELVRAQDLSARKVILQDRRQEIGQDCRAALEEVADADLKALVDAAIEACIALEQGLTRSAQALAVNVWDTALRQVVSRGKVFPGVQGFFKYSKVRNNITPVSDGVSLRQFRGACVLTPMKLALTDYDPANPPLAEFNRHSTAHRVDPVTYSPENAVVAVMLMASLLLEIEVSGW